MTTTLFKDETGFRVYTYSLGRERLGLGIACGGGQVELPGEEYLIKLYVGIGGLAKPATMACASAGGALMRILMHDPDEVARLESTGVTREELERARELMFKICFGARP